MPCRLRLLLITMPVSISKLPSHCKGVGVHPSEVEYVVERVD